MTADLKRICVDIRGVVQGVGFRPFVYELAENLELTGWVANTANGVIAQVQGSPHATDAFLRRLSIEAPPLAFIVKVQHQNLPIVSSDHCFEIRKSQAASSRSALLPPDVCVCDDCRREMLDPSDRRYRYPFINCTNCGPRYTIIDDIPYDRDATTMAPFAMCSACQREYDDPKDRRFHAQPNACFDCGPHVWLVDAKGKVMERGDPIKEAANLLNTNRILAIKGLGGFHLAVNASSSAAVQRLRRKKHREAKPFALMCRNLDQVKGLAHLDDNSLALLTSRHRPIVLVPRRWDKREIADEVAPDNPDIGVMLPYTPLHILLFECLHESGGPEVLVMTSGNASEEPIAIDNGEAIERLGPMVDALLLHNRGILVRNDDSVLRASATGSHRTFLRRSRGYTPLPLMLRDAEKDLPSVLGVGGELKNTICLLKGPMAFLSQHIGDQSNEAAFDSFEDTVARLQRIVDVEPEYIAVDMHPQYATTLWAESNGLPTIAVQHHHAHVAACLAEHQKEGRAIGLALDGTGYGMDGAVWGGEVLVADLVSSNRAGHLAYVRQPGGDRAARQPWRMALSYLIDAFGADWQRVCPAELLKVPEEKQEAIAKLIVSGKHAPLTSSTGRLFDGIAALCGMYLTTQFEAQAAMGLEMAARRATSDEVIWPVDMDDGDVVQMRPSMFVRPLIEDLAKGIDVESVAMRFHRTLAAAFVCACVKVRQRWGLKTVAAGGGCMQNSVLERLLIQGLEAEGFEVLVAQQVPPNDGGLSLGQAVVARQQRRKQSTYWSN